MTGPLDIPRIAEIEERRIAVSLAEIAPESMAWCGGAACRGVPGRWYNSTFGAGLGVTPTCDDVSRLVRYFEERAIEPRAEVSALAGRDVFRAFADAGFVLRSVEDVLVRPLDGALPEREERAAGLSIEAVDASDKQAVDEFAQLTVRGFAGCETPPEEELVIWRTIAQHPRVHAFVARLDGAPAAVASLEMFEDMACLFGATTLPPYQRRGIQSALIAHRLDAARTGGASFATIGSRPAHHTARNAMRHGFQLAYAKVVLVRPGEGLAGTMG